MSHSDEHEAKAREWLYWRDKTKSTDIDSLVALLRSVDAEARREEAAEWVEACENAREKGRREEAEEWTEELLTALNSELDGGDLNANVREILRRRGVKR